MLHYKKFMCKYVNVVLKGDLLGHPFAPNKKLLFGVDDVAAGMVASGLVSGIGSFLSGSSQASAQDRANAANERIAKENREWQSSENALNRSWEEKMWQAQNMYNTPSAMMARYKEAGLNPYLVQKDGSSGIGQASSAGTPSSVAAPNMPNMVASNPLSGLGSLGSAIGTALQFKGVNASAADQQASAVSKLVDSVTKAYKDGGPKLADLVIKNFAPFFTGSDPSSAEANKLLVSQRYNMDMDSLLKDFTYETSKKWTNQEKAAAFENLKTSTRGILSQMALNTAQEGLYGSQSHLNEETIKKFASEIARNFAEAFAAKKQGEYYEVSASQMGIINKMMDLQLQDLEADFAFNTGVRKWKKEIPHRSTALGLFLGNISSQSVSQEIDSNKFLRYGKQVTSMVGDLFKVNFGMSTNRTNFNNLNPDKSGKMFYSGDGYYLNNGVLQKGNW